MDGHDPGWAEQGLCSDFCWLSSFEIRAISPPWGILGLALLWLACLLSLLPVLATLEADRQQ